MKGFPSSAPFPVPAPPACLPAPQHNPVILFLRSLHPPVLPSPAVGEHQHQIMTCVYVLSSLPLPRDPPVLSPGPLTTPVWGWGRGTELLETCPAIANIPVSLSPGLDASSQSSSQEFLVPNDVCIGLGMTRGTTACLHPCVPSQGHFAEASTHWPTQWRLCQSLGAGESSWGRRKGKLKHGAGGKGLANAKEWP